MVLVGPSGSGKSTALRMLAGLEDVDEGGIWIGDRDVTYVRPRDRDVAMVFQSYALYPYLTVAQNIGFPLKIARVKRRERDRRVREVAELLGLADLLERKPGQLSGGQRQRVAMGRAIVREPSAYLMDEPLSNLDAKLRVQMRADIADLQGRLGVTTVYVTHDQSEAMTLGSRVAVLRDGRLQQCAPPRELYERPGKRLRRGVHRLARDELRRGPARRERLGRSRRGPAAASRGGGSAASARGLAAVLVGLRPEALGLAGDGIAARVEAVEVVGADAYVFCSAEVGGAEAASPPARTRARRRSAAMRCDSPPIAVTRISSTPTAVSDSLLIAGLASAPIGERPDALLRPPGARRVT